MKKTSLALALVLCAFTLIGCSADTPEDTFDVLTSFYPMYVFTLNITEGAPDVSVRNMAAPQTGCLHDYTLTTGDMKAIAVADAFVINGAGMELFLEKAAETNAALFTVDTSEGVELIQDEQEHDHDHEGEESHEGHDHGEYNSHIWMDPKNAIIQVQNIADALSSKNPVNAQLYRDNAAAYIERLKAAEAEAEELLSPYVGAEAVAFHESFTYFAHRYGFSIIATVLTDEQNAPDAAELAAAVDEVNLHGIKLLLTDAREENRAAVAIAAETGARQVSLSAVLSGDGCDEKTAYERAITGNAKAIADCLSATP